jgi:aminoglycoside phosphotransferase (APT) family kinase protein
MSSATPEVPDLPRRLLTYLRHALANDRLDYASPPAPIPGGFDTDTYRLELVGAGDVIPANLVLRRFRGFGTSDRALFEHAVQNAVAETGVPAPRAPIVCTDAGVLDGAFFLMEELPGTLLVDAPQDRSSVVLGHAHAALHDVDPAPVAAALTEAGIEGWTLDARLERLRDHASDHPWAYEPVEWLSNHRPPDPERLALCHNDFHKLNILVEGERITAILDWSGFLIADPAFDVATTLVLFSISAKHHIAAGLTPPVDLDQVLADYLAAYEADRLLDHSRLDYYRALRSTISLVRAAQGGANWYQPGMTEDLVAVVEGVTGNTLAVPAGV